MTMLCKLSFYKWMLFIILMINCSIVYSQPSVLEYDVLYKGDSIGGMKLHLKSDGVNSSIKMNSNVEVRFIVSNTIKMQEESYYQNNKLIFSNAKRIVNGTTKQHTQTKAASDYYHTINKGKTNILQVPSITYNLLMLYFKEPTNISEVYSDSFQCFLKIEKIAPHHFRLKLPNDDQTEYFFENGICERILINSTFFKVEMRLRKSSQST